MKKLMIAIALAALSAVSFAGPGGPGGHGGPGRPGAPAPAPAPRPFKPAPAPAPQPRHDGSFWGRGGRNFWPGFTGALVGGLVANTVAPRPVVVTTPTVVATPVVTTPTVVTTTPVVTTPVTTVQNVWVEGRYVDTVQPNGTVIRQWIPGHYEQRTVVCP